MLTLLETDPSAFLEMPRHKRRDLKKKARDLGVELVFSVHLAPEYDLSSGDEQTRLNGIRHCIDLLKTVAQMGGRMIGGCIYSCWPYHYNGCAPDRERLVDTSLKSVRECIKVAEDFEIDYALEVFNRYEQVILKTATRSGGLFKADRQPAGEARFRYVPYEHRRAFV